MVNWILYCFLDFWYYSDSADINESSNVVVETFQSLMLISHILEDAVGGHSSAAAGGKKNWNCKPKTLNIWSTSWDVFSIVISEAVQSQMFS